MFGIGLAMAIGSGGYRWHGIPVTVVAALWAFLLNWLAFVPAYLQRTEKFYDLVGSITYLSCLAVLWCLVPSVSEKGSLVALFVVIWALRLGIFLFLRVKRAGEDSRFAEIKHNPGRFFVAWSLQALWVVITAAAAFAVISNPQLATSSDIYAYAGITLWLAGFSIEVVADWQKSRFRAQNRDGFIQTGLWSWSRHPNYFGEILLWIGIAVIALPTLSGWRWLALVSPLFVFLLIRFVSGVNLLEKKADENWGGDPAYRRYKESTSTLLLWPPKKV